MSAPGVFERLRIWTWRIVMAPVEVARAVTPYFVALGLAILFGSALDHSEPMLREATASPSGVASAGVAGATIAATASPAIAKAGVTGFSVAIGPVGVRKPYSAPTHSLEALRNIPFRSGRAIDEAYRLQFAECDMRDRFGTRRLPKGGCSREPNEFNAFLRLPASEIGAEAVFMDSALSLDLSGGWLACGRGGSRPIDARACGTFFDYPGVSSDAYEALGSRWNELFVSSDTVPYITIPASAPPGKDSLAQGRLFSELSGIEIGDIGVVIYRDRIVPLLVANAGPTHRTLGGSLALFDAIGVERCRTRMESDPRACSEAKGYGLGDNVVTVLFPKSRIEGMSAETAVAKVRDRAMERLTNLFSSAQALADAGQTDGQIRAPKPTPHPQITMAMMRRLDPAEAAAADSAVGRLDERRGPDGPLSRPIPPGRLLQLRDGNAILYSPRSKARPAGTAIVLTATSPRDPSPSVAPKPRPRPERE